MEERSVTVGKTTHKLDNPFFVLATQNPLEMEGTYPLPEAQSIVFYMKTKGRLSDRRQPSYDLESHDQDSEPKVDRVLGQGEVSKCERPCEPFPSRGPCRITRFE